MEDMDTQEREVFEAFNSDNFYYYQTSQKEYNNFIDGLAWVGLLVGAATKVGTPSSLKIAARGTEYIRNILNVGPDARTYAPVQVTDDWIKSETMPNMWYKKKAQSFAGPAGLQFAIDNGANLKSPFDVMGTAKLFTSLAWFYGLILEWPIIGKWLRQHLNSMWLAHLITGKQPPKNLEWTAYHNPFYSYIAGIKMEVEVPPSTKYKSGSSKERDEVVPMSKRKPSSWIWRNWPKSEYAANGNPELEDWSYIPVAYLVAKYLQATL